MTGPTSCGSGTAASVSGSRRGGRARGLDCLPAGVAFAPVAGAAAPGLAFGQAVGRWGNWFDQQLYGRPTTMLPWGVDNIAPEQRVRGYESFATFQPAFLYESIWDVFVGLLVIYAVRRFLLTGDRAFALYAGAYAIGGFLVQSLRIDPSHHVLGLRVNQLVLAVVFAAAVAYLYLTRHKRGPDKIVAMAAPSGTADNACRDSGGRRSWRRQAVRRAARVRAAAALARCAGAGSGVEPHALSGRCF